MKTNSLKPVFISVTILLLMSLTVLLSQLFSAEKQCGQITSSVFPETLQYIEEEAFSNTALESIIFGPNVKIIDRQAFENNRNLRMVYIPVAVERIGEGAFLNSKQFSIHGVSGSYAEKWAEENEFDFTADDIWTDAQSAEGIHLERLFDLFWMVCLPDEKTLLRFSERIRKFFRSMRPQDRPELYSVRLRFP